MKKNLSKVASLSVASISCITVTLLLVSVAIIGSLNVENFTKLISDDFTIVAFIENKADEEIDELNVCAYSVGCQPTAVSRYSDTIFCT